jgi:hypothetical protein
VANMPFQVQGLLRRPKPQLSVNFSSGLCCMIGPGQLQGG